MTKTFLGYPPEHIRNWIIEHTTGGNPPAGAEEWVEACNPDGSPLSETSKAEWVFSDGIERKLWLDEYDGWIWEDEENSDSYGFCPSTHESNLTILKLSDLHGTYLNPEVIAYRKYIPGHWEDADGNWINGSWGEWSDLNYGLKVFWANNGDANPDDPQNPFDGDGWRIPTVYDARSTNINENLINGYNLGIATRTWTTNKDKDGNAV